MADEGLNELFGGNPSRPDKQEFWQLSEIVLKHDADADSDEGLEKVIEQFIPEDVAGYMAVQRSLFMLTMVPEFMLLRLVRPSQFLTLHLSMAASWSDGFCAGAAYQQKYNTPKPHVAECHPDCGPIVKVYYGRHVHENCDGVCSHTNEPEMG